LHGAGDHDFAHLGVEHDHPPADRRVDGGLVQLVLDLLELGARLQRRPLAWTTRRRAELSVSAAPRASSGTTCSSRSAGCGAAWAGVLEVDLGLAHRGLGHRERALARSRDATKVSSRKLDERLTRHHPSPSRVSFSMRHHVRRTLTLTRGST
jgi:hypothetical protein